jgi:hypothetical protein
MLAEMEAEVELGNLAMQDLTPILPPFDKKVINFWGLLRLACVLLWMQHRTSPFSD